MINKKILELLKNREFIDIATADLQGRPNTAPKLFLKIEEHTIYLVDYVMTRTWENLKKNPRACISLMDTETLFGYQLNAGVKIIESGPLYDAIMKDVLAREIELSTKRVVEGITRGKKHEFFEVGLKDKAAIFQVHIEEAVEISPRGELKREKV